MDDAMKIFFEYGGDAAGMDNDDVFSSTAAESVVDGTAALSPSYEDNGVATPSDEQNVGGLYLIDDGETFNGGEARVGVVYDPVSGEEKPVTSSMYSVKYAAKKLGISHQTVRNYAYEISEYLQGGRSAEGNLLFTTEDINLIGDVYLFCKSKGIKKSLAKAYYFNENGNEPSVAASVNKDLSQVTDIKDKFLESMYEKIDRLSDVMVKLSEHLDNNARIISSFEDKLDEHGKSIDSIKAGLEEEKAGREKMEALIRSGNDSVKGFIGDRVAKAKDEIISALEQMPSETAAPDVTELEKSFEETRNTVKGLVKIINRIDTKLAQDEGNSSEKIEKLLGDIKASSKAETKRLCAENEELKKKVQELTDKNALMSNSFMQGHAQEDMDKLLDDNEKLAERAMNAEKAMEGMALRISELESMENVSDESIAEENAVLKKKLEDTRTAFRNISQYVKKLENEGQHAEKDNTADKQLLEDNKRLVSELSKTKAAMKKMAERISVLEGVSDKPVIDNSELAKENEILAAELLKTRTAFSNISKRLKEVEAKSESASTDELYEEMLEDNARLKAELIAVKKQLLSKTKDAEDEDPLKPAEKKKKPVEVKGREKKSLFSKKDRKHEPSDILPVNVIPDEEQLQIEKNARKLDISPVMPDIDSDYGNEDEKEEWHDEIEELPEGLFGIDDVDDGIGDIDIETAIDKRAVQEAKEEQKKAQREKKKKKFFGIF